MHVHASDRKLTEAGSAKFFVKDNGDTVLVIELNLDVIKVADHIIDLGLEGGDNGGTIVVEGTPEKVAKCEKSHTGRFLKNLL